MPLDFLDAPEGVNDAVQPAAEPPAQNEPPVEAAPEPEPTPEPVAPPPTPEPGFVPFAAVLDERDKRKALEAELKAFRDSQARAEPVVPPDPFEDPQGYEAHVNTLVQQARWDAVTSTSMVMAQEKHGADVVQSAVDAFVQETQQKPWLVAELQRQPHPYEWVVNRHKRETAFAKIDPSQVEAFLAWQQQAAASPAAPVSPQPQPAAPAAPKPPVSLVSVPAAGGAKPGQAPVGPGEAFNNVFGGR